MKLHHGLTVLIPVLTALAGAAPSPAQSSSPADRYRLEARATPVAPKLDGRLDEAAWREAPVATGFIQHEPNTGAPASERTEARVIYTTKTLYVGIHAFDSQPEAIIAREMQRDGGLFRDDSVAVLLDTFDDDRNTYFFETNANGARTDSLVTDEGRDTNFEWDGVWDVSSRRTDDGWIAEIAIPFSTLRFDPEAEAWGFNVHRLIRHKNERVDWAPIPRSAELFRVSLYGSLTGIQGVEPGLNLDVKPFVVGADTRTASGSDSGAGAEDFDAGLDVKWGLTRGLSLDLTANTDFAETEVDAQQVNLTRFSLFFPEKREFFLENAGIFEFGPASGGGRPLLKLFFSRRIGIDDGREVPIEGGARLTGRVGAWNLGLLGVRTGSLAGSLDGAGGGAIASNDWGAVRLKRNVGQRSSIGVMLTHREGGSGDHNRTYGTDFDWKPTDRMAVSGFFAKSDDSDLASGDDWSAGVGAEWESATWSWEAGYTEIGERFEPEMGFLLRRGVRRYQGEVGYEPRPDLPKIRQLSFELEAEAVTLRDGTTESSSVQFEPFGVEFDSDDELTFFVERLFERLFENFEIIPGIVIPLGDYTFHNYGVRFESNSSRRLSVEGSVQRGGFFDGDRFEAELSVRARPNRFLRSETTWQYNDIDLGDLGSFNTQVVRQRLGLSLNPRMRTDALVQYNNLSDDFAVNLRFNWIYKPGADLFVVFNQTWEAPGLDRFEQRDRQVIVKFTYLYQR